MSEYEREFDLYKRVATPTAPALSPEGDVFARKATAEEEASWAAEQLVIAGHEQRLLAVGWPPAIVKATCDEFEYMAKLRSGETVHFRGASRISDEWVSLREVEDVLGIDYQASFSTCSRRQPTFDRGLEVRIADIVWAADAPWGS